MRQLIFNALASALLLAPLAAHADDDALVGSAEVQQTPESPPEVSAHPRPLTTRLLGAPALTLTSPLHTPFTAETLARSCKIN
jgi:hypothetical protein